MPHGSFPQPLPHMSAPLPQASPLPPHAPYASAAPLPLASPLPFSTPEPPLTLTACIWPGFCLLSSKSKFRTSPGLGTPPSTQEFTCTKISWPSGPVTKPNPVLLAKDFTVPWCLPRGPLCFFAAPP